ncbi:type I restriction endonuclease subunit R [Geoalkalibacter halelectricus]|uniref:Type I restriction enzyme endonuclease subunit n=1 Tax=Geoalkalibacter halelectricus TaxID=2847045 RepID=A0ABY5ZKW1_9BACT|nr:HsdR family type I site-specific deoxyribonuclease [Geoalkalibacter halelectricus]MDO3377192.1 HsdR family type I site-specific deoxyribonuclease [Geoalkalibacter halelectricus]UWZ79479.1 HsdR family type I site-specific deoxyribonuclease [Geoalkalibacter halelectricus]
MAEYVNVEMPFLNKLRELNWEVIDHGCGKIPGDPKTSKRDSFREVVLKEVFFETVRNINRTDDGRTWLTDRQLDDLLSLVTNHSGEPLLEANRSIFTLLTGNTTVGINELTGEQNPLVRLIDYKHPERNSFIAINQFRIDTPGGSRQCIIPDIVLFVNGLPFVVIECKDRDVAEPLSEAFIQISRYSNRREDNYGLVEGEEKLFHSGLFSILTHGTEARFGTITGEFDHYLNWKDIFPEEYKTISVSPDEERQEVLIHGMLNKAILLDILKNFTVFMEVKRGVTAKVVCRYQQFRAVGKIMDRLRTGQDPFGKSGVVWHTQGSGKSLTMVFLVRKMRESDDLKDYKIIMVNDRVDLEDQLSETAKMTGEGVTIVKRRDELSKLTGDFGNLNMVMVHKFLASNGVSAQSLIDSGVVPQFEPFQVVNPGERVLLLIDEAHRTQGGDMGDNLFTGFPNAVKVAFTGTPLLTERHKQKTHERFNTWIDVYKMKDSVADRATVDILYIGRTSKDQILDKERFREEFEDMFRNRTEEEKQEIQRRHGTLTAYLETEDRIRKIAEDIIEHYTAEILPNGFKGQVVGCSIIAACRYKYELEKALQKRIAQEQAKPDGERDDELLKQMVFMKVAAVVSMMDNNEPGYVSAARRQAQELDAVENFKSDFNFDKPETGVALLCVCDRLLTGFDAPIEQVMYLDKSLQEHDLMQAIARVNRTKVQKSGFVKQHGIVVDYYGVANHLKKALAIYSEADEKELADLTEYFRGLDKEIPVLEARYRRLLQFFQEYKIAEIETFVTQTMTDQSQEFELVEECIQLAADVKFRAQFDTYIKAFFDSLELLFNASLAQQYYIPAKRFGYLLMRMHHRYRDATLDLKWAGAKIRKLLDKYLQSEGIDPKVEPVALLSDEFPKRIDALSKTGKARPSEMEHAIRWHIKVEMEKDPELYTKFSERLQQILDNHKDHWDVITLELSKLREEMKAGRMAEGSPVLAQIAPFYGVITMITGMSSDDPETVKQLAPVTETVCGILRQYLTIANFWAKNSEIQKLESEIEDALWLSGVPALSEESKHLTTELINLAKIREKELLG